jgi:nucleoside-diphosphate-sugar epimerase
VQADIPVLGGDVLSGEGLDRALEDVEVAYYLIHSMERAESDGFPARERVAAERFAAAASAAGVRRIVYLGGLVPEGGPRSDHLASRLEVERILLAGSPSSVALRASIVIGARSRPFRFLVHLVERLPVLALPAWRDNVTSPIDERDIAEMLARCATNEKVGGLSLDAGGRDIVSYGELIAMIRDSMLIDRSTFRLGRLTLTPIASHIATVIAGEEHELIGPLMESLSSDLLPRDDRAAKLLNVRLHSLESAIERSLRVWEETERLAAR